MIKHAAILLPCLLTGGTEVATYETALTLSNLGFKVTVIVYFNEVDSVMLKKFKDADIKVIILGQFRQKNLAAMIRLLISLAYTLYKRYDLVWVQYMTPTIAPLLIAKFFSKKLVSCIHFSANHFSSSGIKRTRWIASHWCDQIICVSHTTAQGFFDTHNSAHPKGKVSIIPNCINTIELTPITPYNWGEMLGRNLDTLIIGYVGRLAHIKGADVLLHAIAKIDQNLPFMLVIVGDGSEKDSLISLTKILGITSKVYFAGRVAHNQVPQAIKGFNMLVVPSRDEGFGLSALEAMAVGVPVVASRVGALSEVVIEGVTGMLCESENPTDFAQKMTFLLKDDIQRKKMGIDGIEHVKQMYDRPSYQKSISDLLAKIGIGNQKGWNT